MSSNAAGYAKWELIVFLLMGIAGGYGATLFLYLHQRVNLLFRPINRERPVLLAIAVGLATAFLIFVSGSYTDSSVGIIALVKDSLNAGHVVEMQRVAGDVEPLGGVLATLLIRTVLTLAGTVVTTYCTYDSSMLSS
jgi:H+/Cl- antiporter ClcA